MNEKKGSKKELVVLTSVLVVIIIFIIAAGVKIFSRDDNKKTAAGNKAAANIAVDSQPLESLDSEQQKEKTEKINVTISDADVYSKAALLSDMDGNMIYGKNEDERIYPASLTKIMTAIIAIENISDLEQKVTIPDDIYDYIQREQASTAGFAAYESVTYKDLLYGTLLSSGAECCLTLSKYVGGSEEAFVAMMNEKAQELGMENTHFTNSIGLHSYEHYSTAHDIAKLLLYALDNKVFYQVYTSPEYYTETDSNPSGVTLRSTMFSELDSDEFLGGKFLGGKTGFTDEAGLCLASFCSIGSDKYILVTTGAEGTHYTEPLHIYDALYIYQMLSKAINPDLYENVQITEPTQPTEPTYSDSSSTQETQNSYDGYYYD